MVERVTTHGAAERDACGIGFVADAHGRASREIVEASLEALDHPPSLLPEPRP